MDNFEERVLIKSQENVSKILGTHDKNLKTIKSYFDVNILIRNDEIKITGDKTSSQVVGKILKDIMDILDSEGEISEQKIVYLIEANREKNNINFNDILKDIVVTTFSGRVIKPKTMGQKRYMDIIATKDISFGIGPAGTGKTYLAVAAAVNALRKKEVERIILTRPAVEAGEKLGFLPGDLQDKVDPYLRPLYDALFDIMGMDNFLKNVEKQVIEVAPLAYMRGRTIDSSFIILDEAQNTTNEQMKMFLTRLGYGSRAVITGDITQIDLPDGKKSGLKSVINILKNVEGIGFMFFDTSDVVRHKLVQDIIKAYEKYEVKK
ncbi:phosphate starvation-inducible PhoH-like protein [Sedimentibacter acidaminivorans]|jgi:phosphate starvation-inducible protein PhoH and related proteins|uniref:PhoH-like protein n=1 Tax=Sedimentibacter acidaminivorans TaxID=913099 RepID=A0ABS4GCN6_9FIRM|nr:PhoH family protein [Sedimentibacter acidaminivorans]MBP1925451.1 phosphate starvation-inducible PhoH-like protein [Sedimentibacter acidaminivorans]